MKMQFFLWIFSWKLLKIKKIIQFFAKKKNATLSNSCCRFVSNPQVFLENQVVILWSYKTEGFENNIVLDWTIVQTIDYSIV